MSAEVLNHFGLNEFVSAQRMQLGRLAGRRGRLGAISEINAEANTDVAIAVGTTTALMALLEELAKTDQARYKLRVGVVQQYIQAIGDLNREITTLTSNTVGVWRAELDQINDAMADLTAVLHSDLKAARTKRDLWAVGLTASAVLLAGAGGWYVFKGRRKKNMR